MTLKSSSVAVQSSAPQPVAPKVSEKLQGVSLRVEVLSNVGASAS